MSTANRIKTKTPEDWVEQVEEILRKKWLEKDVQTDLEWMKTSKPVQY